MKKFLLFPLFSLLLVACGGDSGSNTEVHSTEVLESSSIYWAGSYSGPEEILNPKYLWAYYNTTDGCSYIYTYDGWTLLAGGGSSQTYLGQRAINVNDGKDGMNGIDGKDGVDGKDGINGVDGKDGNDGVDGKDGIDGKDGKDGEDGFVFIRSARVIDDGVTYDVKSYAQLEAGNPYFYIYYKFYFVEDDLAKTYACYHNMANIRSPKVAYWDFTEDYCMETSYIKTYSNTGYVLSTEQVMYSNNTLIRIIYTYYPYSSTVHYYAQYQGGKLLTAAEYDRNGNSISTNSSTILAAIENSQNTEIFFNNDESDSTDFVKSIALDRYHILGTSDNRNILATLTVDDLSTVDTSGGIFVQIANFSQDTVVNFRPYFVQDDTIKAVIATPKLSYYTATGKEYTVRLKVGEKIYRNTYRRFNISSSYSNITLNAPARINIEKVNSDSFTISINGYNLDFIDKMDMRVLNSAENQVGDSVNVNLTPIQWLSDTCKNAQKISAIIPTPKDEGTYTLELHVNDSLYKLSNNTFIVHRNPYFTSFTIPETSIIYVGDFVTATLKGKNFVNAALDISQLNLTFSDGYKVIDTLKYEATVVKDSIINLKIYVPQKAGKYDIEAHYESATIHAKFGVSECLLQEEGAVNMIDGVYKICKSKTLVDATPLEYDTYGKVCSTDGAIVAGEVVFSNKYVCDADTFRVANEQEIDLNKGCVSYTEGNEIRKTITSELDSVYLCADGLWTGSRAIAFGVLTDARDNRTYKTVVIGSQTWMAENLNYSDSITYSGMKGRSWCYNNKVDSCSKYGRLYNWAAAMDSAGMWSTNGKGCGYGKTCSVTTPARGICPEGWHLPSKTEWETLFIAVGGKSTAGKDFKSTSGWNSNGNGTDAYGFSALPAGNRDGGGNYISEGTRAYFWSSTEDNSSSANYIFLRYSNDNASQNANDKDIGFSVRCLKDSI